MGESICRLSPLVKVPRVSEGIEALFINRQMPLPSPTGLLAACKGDRRLGHRGRSYHAPAPLRALFSSIYAVLIPCVRPSPEEKVKLR